MSIRSRALRKTKKPTAINDATINVADLNSIVAAARPLIEDWLDIADQLAAFRETADEKNLDWSQIKNLVKATILDERDDGDRVQKLAAKAEKVSEYLELLKPNSGDKKSPDNSSGGVESRHATVEGSSRASKTSRPEAGAEVAPGPLEANSKSTKEESTTEFSAPSSPSPSPHDGSDDVDSPCVGKPESEPAVFSATALGQREAAGDTALPAGSLPNLDDIPEFLRRPLVMQ